MTSRPYNNPSSLPNPSDTDAQSPAELTVAKPMHPEDIAVGDDVAILFTSSQYATFNWYGFDTSILPIEQPIAITYLPYGDQEALVVQQICLPFVVCKTFDDRHRYLDIRQVRLARLNKSFAAADRKARLHDQKAAASENEKTSKKKKRRKKKKKSKRK